MADTHEDLERVRVTRHTDPRDSDGSTVRRVGGFLAELPILLLVAVVLDLGWRLVRVIGWIV